MAKHEGNAEALNLVRRHIDSVGAAAIALVDERVGFGIDAAIIRGRHSLGEDKQREAQVTAALTEVQTRYLTPKGKQLIAEAIIAATKDAQAHYNGEVAEDLNVLVAPDVMVQPQPHIPHQVVPAMAQPPQAFIQSN